MSASLAPDPIDEVAEALMRAVARSGVMRGHDDGAHRRRCDHEMIERARSKQSDCCLFTWLRATAAPV
jgi:hypothetical protein